MVVTDGVIVLLCLRLVGVDATLLPVAIVLGSFFIYYPLTALPLAGLGVLDAALVVTYTETAGMRQSRRSWQRWSCGASSPSSGPCCSVRSRSAGGAGGPARGGCPRPTCLWRTARDAHQAAIAWSRTLRHDAQAGVVLGVQSVPDGLATGLLAGLSPLNGLYGYMVGTLAGAAVTSSAFMVVQGTGAMAMVIADVPGLHGGADQAQAVATLAVLTGAVMLLAGLLKLGSLLRFVSNAVLVGFMNAVGVNIVLGQVANLTGYAAPGDNRIVRTSTPSSRRRAWTGPA